jgi:hypothetical protein
VFINIMSDFPFIVLDSRRVLDATDPAKWLGRIVRYYKKPSASYTPDNPTALAAHSTEELVISDFEAQLNASNDVTLQANLGSLASALRGHGNETTFSFQTSTMKIVRLVNYNPKYFAELRQLPEVQESLGEYLRPGGRPAYMIVGVMIWTDPSFRSTREIHQTQSMNVQAPVGAIVGATTVAMPLPAEITDPGVGSSAQDAQGTQMGGSMAGSYICGIEYSNVRRKLYSLMKNFTPVLEDHGPRMKGDQVLGGNVTPKEEGTEEGESALFVELDNDVVWTDTLPAAESLQETEFSNFTLAYEPTDSSTG